MLPTVMSALPVYQSADTVRTFLAPGQRFRSDDGRETYTVSCLRRDSLGLLHVTLRSSAGRTLSAFAEQVETAVRDGDLVPVAGSGSLTRC